MKFFKKYLFMLFVLSFLSFAPQCFAEIGPMEKLGRGVINIAFGPLELIQQPMDVAQEKGNLAAISYGLFRGIGMTVARIVVGSIDVVTFLMPLPGCPDEPEDFGWGYGPMIRPAWVVDHEHNAYNFFYDDNALSEKM